MTNENIVKRLRDEADKATLRVDDTLAAVLNEAAAEIERLEKLKDEYYMAWMRTVKEEP